LVKKYFKGHLSDSTDFKSAFQCLDLANEPNQFTELEKLLQILFLGQIVGLPTLNSILLKFSIVSNSRQIKYNRLCKSLTESKMRKIFEYVFEAHLIDILTSMSKKDSSCWSKSLVTVVLDDSIFRQWLKDNIDDYYGCYFSGQYKATVYGYKVVTLAVAIDGVLYPLYFDFVRNDKTEKSVEVAQKLVKRWGKLVEKLKNQGVELPVLHFSCDSAYSDIGLNHSCETNYLTYISVPKKSHLIELSGEKIKLSDWISAHYLELEQQYQEQQKELSEDKKTPFTYRFRALYLSQNREITFLAFRLNGSQKVSLIYSTDKHIFAKTLRRHWFQRTYIEQFFKLLKHVLKIQEARSSNKQSFEMKLWRFAFMAWHAQKLVVYVRRFCRHFDKKGFVSMQRILCSDDGLLDLLQNSVATNR
jgi:hypothetical protein